MNISIVTGGGLCLPLVHFLKQNRVNVSVFCDEGTMTKDPSSGDMLRQFCTGMQVPLHEAKYTDVYSWLKQTKPNITFLIGYGHLIDISMLEPQALLHTYNIHFGELPQYKGANPVFWQLKNGTDNLTVTIHNINHKFDDGPQVWVKHIRREQHYTFGTANDVLSHVTVEGVIYILNQLASGKPVQHLPVNGGNAKYYPKPGLKDVLINWHEMTGKQIVDLVQACTPWNKGAITYYNNQPVKMLDAEIIDAPAKDEIKAGTIVNVQQQFDVVTSDGKVLRINMLNINDNFIPGRHVSFFGFKEQAQFTNNCNTQ
ncbi:MAG TPA: formyltransferase family protein [Flavipsychrobacter sp.]